MKTMVIALGGNAILQPGQKGSAEQQQKNIITTAEQIALLVRDGYRIAMTHGNGPQVGNILIQNEMAKEQAPALPMDMCGAESQGLIGYMIQMHLKNSLKLLGLDVPVVTLVTQTKVAPDDPAFDNPSKPVGPFKDRAYAKLREDEFGETWIEDSGRGWRRVVPSPDPVSIVEASSVKALLREGHVIIAAGGGGVPVVETPNGLLSGVEAVVDKDLSAQRLATSVDADKLLILTDVNGAALHYGTPTETYLGEVTSQELSRYKLEGHFHSGSMKPKVQAIMRFVEQGGDMGVIASLNRVLEAVRGETGTRLYAGR